ncbi:MAG: hypothetical protein U9P80_02570, partial [Thermodesulfobacteriota bacterium]|nr:hypothetical protein [Thermodesulfobacteriota bacterium]
MQDYVYRKPDNLVELFETAIELFSHNRLFGVKRSDGKTVEWMSYKETGVRVDNFRAGLAGLGVSSGDAVG